MKKNYQTLKTAAILASLMITAPVMAGTGSGQGAAAASVNTYSGVEVLQAGAKQASAAVQNEMAELNNTFRTMRVVTAKKVSIVTATASGRVKLRWAPSTSAESITSLPRGYELTLLAEGTDWVQVRDEKSGYTGFVYKKYVNIPEESQAAQSDAGRNGQDITVIVEDQTVLPEEEAVEYVDPEDDLAVYEEEVAVYEDDDDIVYEDEEEMNGTAIGKDEILQAYSDAEEEDDELLRQLEEGDLNQTMMNLTAADRYTIWDDLLNDVWAYLKATLPADKMTNLLAEQRKWIDEKEAAALEEASAYEGGSIYGLIYNNSLADQTRDRVEELMMLVEE